MVCSHLRRFGNIEIGSVWLKFIENCASCSYPKTISFAYNIGLWSEYIYWSHLSLMCLSSIQRFVTQFAYNNRSKDIQGSYIIKKSAAGQQRDYLFGWTSFPRLNWVRDFVSFSRFHMITDFIGYKISINRLQLNCRLVARLCIQITNLTLNTYFIYKCARWLSQNIEQQ